jgi:thiol:disulfide interchange protein DsbA
VFLHLLCAGAQAAEQLPGDYQVIKGERSLHTPGKVLLLEFADFYCPHCHLFEKVVTSQLQKEFGERLEVRLVGFPVIRGKLSTAFEMYEQARVMGKGSEMKGVLFRTIHKEKIHVLDRGLRSLLLREVGLDGNAFEAGLASGEPYKALEKSRAWGKRIKVKHTPTVVLDGNLLVSNLKIDNLRTLINGILKKDKTP